MVKYKGNTSSEEEWQYFEGTFDKKASISKQKHALHSLIQMNTPMCPAAVEIR